MKYFTEDEFREWYPFMDQALLLRLDLFRHLWNAPVAISPHPGSLGRKLGPHSRSQHNIDMHGAVMAVDVFPEGLTRDNAYLAYHFARSAGFTGIGIYSDTQPGWMLHLDVRTDRPYDDPATWSRADRAYASLEALIPSVAKS